MAFKLGAFLGGAADAISKGIEENEKRVQLLTDRALDYHTKLRLQEREEYKNKKDTVRQTLEQINGLVGGDMNVTSALVQNLGIDAAKTIAENAFANPSMTPETFSEIVGQSNGDPATMNDLIDFTVGPPDVDPMPAESLIPETEASFLFDPAADARSRYESVAAKDSAFSNLYTDRLVDKAAPELDFNALKSILTASDDPVGQGTAMRSAALSLRETNPELSDRLMTEGNLKLALARALEEPDNKEFEISAMNYAQKHLLDMAKEQFNILDNYEIVDGRKVFKPDESRNKDMVVIREVNSRITSDISALYRNTDLTLDQAHAILFNYATNNTGYRLDFTDFEYGDDPLSVIKPTGGLLYTRGNYAVTAPPTRDKTRDPELPPREGLGREGRGQMGRTPEAASTDVGSNLGLTEPTVDDLVRQYQSAGSTSEKNQIKIKLSMDHSLSDAEIAELLGE